MKNYSKKIINLLENIPVAFKTVFTKPKYMLITVLFTILIYSFNAIITNISLLKSMFSFKLLTLLVVGSAQAMGLWMVLQLFLLSFLAGIVLSMSIFIVLRQISFNAGVGSSGILASIIAPCCPSCAMGLLSVLGIGGFLSFLPFKGAEISILAILLLVGTTLYLSKVITTTVCKL